MDACSFGNVAVRPYDEDSPVIDIYLPKNASEYTFSSLYSAAEAKLRSHYDGVKVNELAEYCIIVAPPGIDGSGATVAAAPYNSYKSVFLDTWFRVMVILHEIG